MVFSGFLPDTPLVSAVLVIVATAIIWLGSGWLEESAARLSAYYGLPAIVQGSIVVAVGSSFPEFASVVFAGLAGAFDLGVGAIVGSAIFNVLVIPALSGLFSDAELETSRAIVYKEAQFYMIAVSAVIITFALAVIYLPLPGGSPLDGQLTRPLAMIPLLLYGLYLFIQYQDVGDHTADEAGEAVVVRREWLKLLAGLGLILIAVEQLVASVESLGGSFGVPAFLTGVTIVAAATSLPDTIVSVRSARDARSATSLGNVFGSNTFDLLVAIPVGVLIVGSVPIDFAVAVPMLGVLTLATVLLFVFLRTELSLTNAESAGLLFAYCLFVVWIVTETIGATNVIRGI